MTTTYLLSCSCGQKVSVQPRQAGEVVKCTCGASLDVPTMLEMAALEEAQPESGSPQPSAAPWGIRQSLALLGAVIFLAALGLAVLLMRSPPSPPARMTADMTAETIRQKTMELTPLQALRLWQSFLATGPDGRTPIQEQIYANMLDRYGQALLRWRLTMGLVLLVAVVGLGLVVVPLLKK